MTRSDEMHRAVDQICDTWYRAAAVNRAHLKAHAYDTAPISGGDGSDPTGNTVVNGRAPAWLAELHDVAITFLEYMPVDPEVLRRAWHALFVEVPDGWSEGRIGWRDDGSPIFGAVTRMYHLADLGLRWFPPLPPKPDRGQLIEETVVGERGNQVDVCALCTDPAPSGRDVHGRVLVHRIEMVDGTTVVLHASTCYYRVDRRARAHGMSIGGYLNVFGAAA